MSHSQIPRPTDSELEIMQILWQHGPASVRFVNDLLSEKRDVGYTTTLKLLQIMYEKGLVTRDDTNRTHVYQAAFKESDMQQRLLDQFVDTAFRGSAVKMVMQALGNHRASRAELDEIKALIEKLEKDKE
ncbi:MAG TPA: BlaI/MecI/CopY family transcriptional regulator [Saprospiraceae bacterium]|nr:BlaI/MecI/CopY family transcriptional regulator [Saprospiraceae bacterium]